MHKRPLTEFRQNPHPDLTAIFTDILDNQSMIMQKVAPVLDWMEFVASRFLDRFQSKVSIYFETDQYILKTAENSAELSSVLKLRHQVFFEELQNKRNLFKIELDQHDLKCDHLLIVDRITSEVVGCYRLLSSHFVQRFYSESEFALNEVLSEPGAKLELGRACILPSHRNGQVIQLLWRGITTYMQKTDSRFLMGCSSVQTMDPAQIQNLVKNVADQNLIIENYSIIPKAKYHPMNHGISLHPIQTLNPSVNPIELPALIQSYLRAGAKLAPIPAVDRDFSCIDFFTLLDRKTMNPLFVRRYFGK